jgi:hypothetical protein
MRRLLRLCLLIAAFLIDTCLDRGGRWVKSDGEFLGSELPGGVCVGIKAK